MKLRLVCIALALLLAAPTITAQTSTNNATATSVQVPRLIRFSGTLNPPSPASAAGGVVNVTFSLYQEETGGTSLWQETQNVEVDATGHYTALLGTTQAEGLPIDLFTSAQAQWLGVRPEGQAEQPRIMLVSVPFALKAGDAETFGGKPPSAYVTAAPASGTNSTSSANPSLSPTSTTAGSVGSQTKNSTIPSGQITGSGTANYIPVWSSSSNLTISTFYQSGLNLGIGTTTPVGPLDVRSASGPFTISGLTAKTGGIGVFGQYDQKGSGFGVLGGTSSSDGGAGVFGNASSDTGLVVGVDGQSASSSGAGVFGIDANGIGVEGQTFSAGGYGGTFFNTSTSTLLNNRAIALGAETAALGGISLDSVAVGPSVTGQKQSQTIGNTLAVWGDTNQTNGIAVIGTADDGNGVVGLNNAPSDAAGSFTNYDTTGTGSGGFGVSGTTTSPNGFGVYGNATAASGSAVGVYGTSTTSFGAEGWSSANWGIVGYSTASPGDGAAAIGLATSGNANGLYADTYSADGFGAVIDNAAGGPILIGTVLNNGVDLFDVDGFGDGYYAGNLDVTGAITAGTKDFKIDHPLDPANKYLVHASVESSEMMNIYTGNATTDGEGVATVQLPEWFEALNRDFRYQLTVMGQFAQAIVAEKVANHQFSIKTDKPNVEVSWQVTGVRQDAFAKAHPLRVEEEKAAADRGHYLHPELFGAPKEARISHRSGSGAAHKAPAMHPLPVKAARAQLQQPITPPALRPVLLPAPPQPPVLPKAAK